MKATNLIPILALLVPAAASADPSQLEELDTSGLIDHAVAAPRNALELSVAAGYSQGAGAIGGGMADLDDVATAGGVIDVGVGYRITPNLALGAYGTLAKYANGDAIADGDRLVRASAGVQAAWHFRPDRSVDPFVSLGGGWQGLWINPDQGKTTSLQGLELARLQLGVDYRLSEDVSIAPVVGGSLGMFVSQDSPMTADATEITDKKVNFTGFAGIAGRFDLGGHR
jgi:outer membrane protein W